MSYTVKDILRIEVAPALGCTEPAAIAFVKEEGKSELAEVEDWVKELSLKRILELIDDLDPEDMAFLEESVHYNMRLTEYGLKHGPGLGVGKTLERLVRQRLIKKDMILAARMLTSAAADACMAGVKLPAMSSAGSGNHGLTAVPVMMLARQVFWRGGLCGLCEETPTALQSVDLFFNWLNCYENHFITLFSRKRARAHKERRKIQVRMSRVSIICCAKLNTKFLCWSVQYPAHVQLRLSRLLIRNSNLTQS